MQLNYSYQFESHGYIQTGTIRLSLDGTDDVGIDIINQANEAILATIHSWEEVMKDAREYH